jgi:hypothetical protein
MAKIFLSYRRDDSIGVSGRIYDRLHAHFGPDAVFRDIDNIPFGVDFREYIDSAVGRCDLVLVVIGKNWAGEIDAYRRIDDPRDFVCIEVEGALKRNIPVIPILIDRTTMPNEADLPPSLAGLTYRNAIDMDQGRDSHPHVDRLIRGIELHFQSRQKKGAEVDSTETAADGPGPPPAVRSHQAAILKKVIGIKTAGEVFTPLFEAGRRLPSTISENFTNQTGGGTVLEIVLSQKDESSVETIACLLISIPPAPDNALRIIVKLKISADKQLRVKTTVSETASVQEFGPFPVE